MHENKMVAWFYCLPFILLTSCVGDRPPVVASRSPAPSAQVNETKKPAPVPTSTATTPPTPPATTPTPVETPTSVETPTPVETPPVTSTPTQNKQAAVSAKTVEQKDIPGENKSRTPDLRVDGIHDPNNPALATMQNPSQSLSALPLGKWGEIDWMQALSRNAIRPRAAVVAEGKMELLDLDIIMTNTKSMPYVRFPHNAHTQWLACSNCHPNLFAQKKGSTPMTMDAILKGQFCGTCHGNVAFSSYICQRCHSVVHEGSPNKWW